jgi:Ras-related protein Rab-18
MSEIYDENENDIFQKIIVVGDSSVGKSAIITRYTRKKYEEKYVPTIGKQYSKILGVDMGKQTLVIGD